MPTQEYCRVTNRAEHILVKEVAGISGQFHQKHVDYTAEREWLFREESVKSIIADIKQLRLTCASNGKSTAK